MGMSSISPSFQNPPPSTGRTLWLSEEVVNNPQVPKTETNKSNTNSGWFLSRRVALYYCSVL